MFCTKCGFEIKDGYKFCPKCGTPVYVEKEVPQSEVKTQVEDVKNETSKKETEPKQDVYVKDAAKSKATSSSQKTSTTPSINKDYIPNPLIELELDIEGVKKMAEKGNKIAMLRQAFRYEMGIGVEKDVVKAAELYEQAGGKDVLLILENSHINSILPDPLYDTKQPPTFGEKENSGVYLKVIPFVKDLMLDYAFKIEEDKKTGGYSKKKSEEYYNVFMEGLNKVCSTYPEFFLSFNNNMMDGVSPRLFERIKRNVEKRYSLKWIPSLFNYTDYIDERKIEIPSIYHICSDGWFILNYETPEMKLSLLNQFVLSVLLQIPIKKINLQFVDLSQRYEEEFLIKNLDPKIYRDKPISTSNHLEELINRIENRRLEVIKKYGNYPDYCEKNHSIPIPYELIILLDDYYYEPEYEKYVEKIEAIKTYGHSIGVYLVEFREQIDMKVENDIFDSNRNIILSRNKSDFNAILRSGLSFERAVLENPSKPIINNSQCDIRYGVLYHFNNDFSFLATGYGNYEVVLKPRAYSTSSEIYNKNHYKLLSELFNFTKEDIEHFFLTREDIIIRAFTTENDAKDYIHNLSKKISIGFPINYNPKCVCLLPCVRGTLNVKLGLALYIPDDLIEVLKNYKEDLLFYFHALMWPQSFLEKIFDYISSGKVVPSDKNSYISVSTFIDTDCLWLNEDYTKSEFTINSIKYKGWFFRYNEIIDLPFGIITGDKKNKESIIICKKFINEEENKLTKAATQKWGKDYAKEHICFSGDYLRSLLNGFYLSVEEKKHYCLSVLQYSSNEIYKKIGKEGFISSCFHYMESEINAKDEMKVRTLDFGSAAENKYETDLSTMTIPVGKAEAKEADFSMDLVSHVHSFIIGQSGSGKSVFLHNIIGGAMLKYAPEDLQLYLLDFKLGGVEFNRYQGAKHVKALLVDNSDPQVTLEILRELRNSMTERGKLLRGAGVNNIGEYNKLHQEDRMPHVLVVADECHEMFKADDSIPRQVRNEISDIVIKIAKEGRSQGVHLVFATQTLSGTEISSEIINNVSDFYLLKCAQTDSERLVPNSSNITSELSTGQIYYHHVDEQVKFQAYYTDKETAEKLMAAIVEKAKDHKSNGEFYFNGAQMFYLDESLKEQMLAVKGKSPLAFMGKAIDISQKDLYIKLNEDFSENVLLLGLNDQEQVTRTTMNLFVSLMMSAKVKHKDIAFKVIDCLNNEEGEVHELIFDLENAGYCEIIERRQRSRFFKELAQSIQNGTAEETILLILGQDRFRELKMDMELEDGDINSTSSSDDPMLAINAFLDDDGSSSNNKSVSNIKTYREALNIILDKGPDYGVHTLLQIEKINNFLFENYISSKELFQKFKHLIMLRSDEMTGSRIGLSDDIRLEKLSSDWERLRAYYYAEESDSYTLFTPYMPSKSKDIINLLNTI